VYGFLNHYTGVAVQKSAPFVPRVRHADVAPQNDASFGIGTLAGLLLGKTTPNSVYGLKKSPIVNCATVLAV
jgi:hypothetical protein